MRLPLLLLAAILATALARPKHGRHHQQHRHHRDTVNAKCAPKCSGVQSKFRYAAGRSYAYSYSAETEVALPHGAASTTVKQTATAIVSVISNCELVLKLSDVSLEGVDAPEWKSALEANPLRFGFDDGAIVSLCPEGDAPWVVNAKRGVLSAFQAALTSSRTNSLVFENDVSGNCPTEYRRSEERGAEVLRRTKNLVECSGHHGNYSSFRAVPYTIKSKVQNTPLMKSQQECTHTIKDQILQSAECTETHEFNPMNKDSSEGIVATTIQKLTFTKQDAALACCTNSAVGKRQSLNFDHSEYAFEESAGATLAAQGNLRDLCASSQNDVRPETPGLFTELVYNLRKMSEADIRRIQAEAKTVASCPRQAQFFQDALPMCASEDCLAVMTEVLSSGSLSEAESSAWVMSLALVPKPSKAMVATVTGLVDRLPAQGLLGVSSLVAGYCRENRLCAETPEVETFVSKLIAKLGPKCKTSSTDQEEQVTLALKALGNVGSVQSAMSKILECAEEKKNPMGIRVAAVQALRRMPCTSDLKTKLTERLSEESEDVELRLTAFLGLVRCPTPETIKTVVELLENEPINQVSSFIYSYLRAKQRSGSPQSVEIGRQLRKHSLHRRFARDPLRFSNFYEFGSLMDSANVGAHIDDAIIFVPKSNLPRQAFANLTVHLFGSSINLLEVGGRFEGMDYALSKLFGHSGYFTNPTGALLDDDIKSSTNSRVQKFQDLWKNRMPQEKALAISGYMRVFGDELATYTYRDPKIMESVKEVMNVNNAIDALKKLTSMKFNKNVLFMDSVLTVPTLAGIPLRLAVNGTASVSVEVDSKTDLGEMIRKARMELQGHLKPSAAVELSASLTTDIRGRKSGARFITRIHSSTDVKASVKLLDGKFTSRLELPQDKMEIIDIQSSLISVAGNVETIENGVAGPRSQPRPVCTPNELNRISGLKMCGEMTLPGKMSAVPFVPLTGPVRTRLTIEKDDATLTAYEFSTQFGREGKREAMISFNTPGSTVDREVRASMELKAEEVAATLRYPGKEVAVKGKLDRSGDVQKGNLALTIDNKDEYTAEATLKMGADGAISVESEVVRPNASPVKMTGELATRMPRFAAIAKIDNLYATPLEFKAITNLEMGSKTNMESELELKCPSLNLDSSFNYKREKGDVESSIRISHQRPGVDAQPHVASWTHVEKMMKKDGENKMEISQSSESNWYPEYDMAASYNMHTKNDLIQNRLNLKYGPAKNSIDLDQTTKITEGDKYTTEVSAVCSKLALDHKAVIVYQNRFPEKFLLNSELDTPRQKGIKLNMEMSNAGEKSLDLKSSASLEYPGRKIELKNDLKETKKGEYKSQASLNWAPNHGINLVSDLKMKRKSAAEYDYEINSEAEVKGASNAKYDMHKRFALGADKSTYTGFLKSNGQSFYDFKMVVESKGKNTEMTSHIRSQVANVDFDVEGKLEAHKKKSKATATLKKDQKDFLRGEVIYPEKMGRDDEKHLKAAVSWALDTPNPSQMALEYQLETPNKDRTHTLSAKADIGAGKPYDMEVRVHKSDHYAFNITATEAAAKILDFSVGIKKDGPYSHPSELALDMNLESSAPFPERNYALLLTHNCNDDSFTTTGFAECKKSNSKYDFSADYKKVQGKMVQYKVSAGSKTRRASLDTELDFDNLYDFSSVRGGKTKVEGAWDGDKAAYESEWTRRDGVFNYKNTVNTPFKAMAQSKSEVEMSSRKMRMESNWGEGKRVMVELEGDVEPAKADLSAKLESSYQALANLDARLKYHFQKEWELDSSLNWGEAEQIRFYHKSGHRKFDVGFISKVGEKDMEAKLKTEVKGDDYKAEATLKNSPSVYTINGNVNTASKTGRFEVETPSEAMKSVAVSVKKNGDEWEIESDKNGDATLQVKSILKLEDGDHHVKLSVEKTSMPFALEYEGKFTDAKWRLKAEVTRNPSDNPIVYGLHISDHATSEANREVEVLFRHPSRQTRAKVTTENDLPRAGKISIHLNPNVADNRAPTKITATYDNNDLSNVAEIHIQDPALPNGLKATQTVEKEGCDGGVLCVYSIRGKIIYSDDAAKTLQGEMRLGRREQAEQERTRDGATIRVSPVKTEAAFTITHPATDLHFRLFGHHQVEKCGEETCKNEGEAGVEFKTESKEVKQYSVSGSGDVYGPAMSFQMTTPEMRWGLRSENGAQSGEHRLVVTQDSKQVYVVVVRGSTEDNVMLLEIRGDRNGEEEVLFHSSARLVNKDLAQMRLWHTEKGKRIEDGEVSVRLDRADLLNTKFYLRPGLDRELQFAAQKAQESMAAPSENHMSKGFRHLINTEGRLREEMLAAMQPLLDHWSSHKNAVSADFGPVFEEISDVFMLYWELIRELTLASMDVLEQSLDQIVDTVPSKSAVNAYYATKDAMRDIPATMGAMIGPFSAAGRSLAATLSELQAKITDIKNSIAQNMNTAAIQSQLEKVYEEVKDYPVISQIVQWLMSLKEQVQLEKVQKSIKDYYNKAGKEVEAGKESVVSWFGEWEGTIVEYELGRVMVELVKEAWQNAMATINYISPEDRVDDAIKWVRDQFHAYRQDSLGMERYVPRMVKNDPEEGEYEILIPLPAKARSLEHLAESFHPDNLQAIKNRMSEELGRVSDAVNSAVGSVPPPSGDLEDKFKDVLHTVQGYQATQFAKTWPYESRALLVGDEHFVTFDGRVFAFKAECDYLLAHDFDEQRFSLHGSFAQHNGALRLHNLRLRAQNHEVEMTRDGSVKVDGAATELPWQEIDEFSGPVKIQVTRRDSIVSIKTKDGIRVSCDSYYQVCWVELSGHYHGKVAGLLGSNDNEQSNDFDLPDGSRAENANDLAQGWHSGGPNCAKASSMAESVEGDSEECSAHFASRSSPFGACFSHVNPVPFRGMCEAAVAAGKGSKGVCNIGASYAQLCKWTGISADMPKECISCETPSGTLEDGEDNRIESVPGEPMDLVFLVEERPCNEARRGDLAKLGGAMSGDVRFGVMGYGGEGVHSRPHFHTGKGSLNFDLNGLKNAAATLDFMNLEIAETEAKKPAAMQALHYLTKHYQFRPAARKVVVLVSCGACDNGRVGFYELQTALLNSGIQLHILADTPIELQSGPAAHLIGLDASRLLEGSGSTAPQERSELVSPHDSCTILAQETNGAVFNSNEGASVGALGVVIGEKAPASQCQICECTTGCTERPMTKCFPCDIPQPVSLSGNTGFFNIPYLGLKKPSRA